MKVGLALGGGGARGFAHIGLLEVLEKEKIKIDMLSGTSMGSVIGGLYAVLKNSADVKDAVYTIVNDKKIRELEANFSKISKESEPSHKKFQQTLMMIKELYIWNLRVFKRHFVDFEPFELLFKELFGVNRFVDCKIPFTAVATDVVDADVAYLREGKLYESILASIALPGIFPPRRINGRILVDGGVVEPVPVDALFGHVDFIIGASVEPKIRRAKISNSLDVLLTSDEIRYIKIMENTISKADILIEPDLNDYSWAEFSKIEEIILKGREEAERMLPDLKRVLRKKKYIPFSKKNKVKMKPFDNVWLVEELEHRGIGKDKSEKKEKKEKNKLKHHNDFVEDDD